MTERVTVRVEDRQLVLTNMDKVLYPAAEFTKADVISYYSRIAPVLLPHLAGRPVTFVRFPDGVDGEMFFEKNVPRHAPDWIRTVRLPSSGTRSSRSSRSGQSEYIDYVLIEDLPALVWAANLAALELHTPQWTVTPKGTRRPPDRLVFDLDPGAGATIVDCCRVAERLHDILVADGLTPVAKTSGSKGMQLSARTHTSDPRTPSAYAKTLAERLTAETPELVVATMAKQLRRSKVFIDWSQNHPAKPPSPPTRYAAAPSPPCPHPSPGTKSVPAANPMSLSSPRNRSWNASNVSVTSSPISTGRDVPTTALPVIRKSLAA